jgi:cell wall-associated NlpC family hydrolase
VPYVNGGSDPSGFDCSGFVAFVFAQHGIALPRTVESQATVGEDVAWPAAGDLVFFRTSGRRPSHVGIALGPDRFIHAPSSRGVVRIEMLAAPYWADRFVEARRVFQPDQP